MDRVRLEQLEQQLARLAADTQDALIEVRRALDAKRRRLVRVIAILDKSGSMAHLTDDTIGGFNKFIAEQRADRSVPTEVSLVQFASPHDYRVEYRNLPVDRVPALTRETYVANGMSTALNDAIITTLEDFDRPLGYTTRRVDAGSLAHEPGDADVAYVVCIITDGIENASRATREAARDLLSRLEKRGNFTVAYLGAHADTWAEAGKYGVLYANSYHFTPTGAGVNAAYSSISRGLSSFKHDYASGGAAASAGLFADEPATNLVVPPTPPESVPTESEGPQ